MALQSNNFLRGKIGNLIYYSRSGKYFVKVAPERVNQSAATKNRSRNFGLGASLCKTLRQLLTSVLPDPKNRSMQSRFSGAFSKWLGTSNINELRPLRPLPFVTGFSFVPDTSMAERFRVPLQIETENGGTVKVLLPAFVPVKAIHAPVRTTRVDMLITVAAAELRSAQSLGSSSQTVHIEYTNSLQPALELLFPVATLPGSVVVVAAALRYQLPNGKQELRPAFLPASVMDAWYV